jgi:hypothetical protein
MNPRRRPSGRHPPATVTGLPEGKPLSLTSNQVELLGLLAAGDRTLWPSRSREGIGRLTALGLAAADADSWHITEAGCRALAGNGARR